MTFPFLIDLDDAVPIYAQIERQIRALLGRGYWAVGDRLPSVRETAARLRVNPLTVVKAYRALQQEGLLETRPGAGVYAARVPKTPRGAARQDILRRLEEAADEAAARGIGREELEEMFTAALDRLQERRKK
ncbi:MAG TPA: GntR family transcriptional regulator [Planctomycetota bacterium]